MHLHAATYGHGMTLFRQSLLSLFNMIHDFFTLSDFRIKKNF